MHLLREVEKFLSTTEISAARFVRDAMGDPRFVFDLRKGREPRLGTVSRVRAYLNSCDRSSLGPGSRRIGFR